MPEDPLKLSEAIGRSYKRYLRSAFRLKHPELSASFDAAIDQFDFTKGPILEATPPLEQGDTVEELIAGGILDEHFRDLVPIAFPYLAGNPLYRHQSEAITRLSEGRNVVVASGTGSGKTESFLIPILDTLFRQHRQGERPLGPGVHALILYPMNALANDQLRRLRGLARALDQVAPDLGFTFGRYIGQTKDTQLDALEHFKQNNPGQEPAPGELLSREEMRDHPPAILITNYAMLEYLLVRPWDSSLFDALPGAWQFVVLDEAHTYSGAKGNEMAMLLRRLKDAIGIAEPGHIRCIATSATIAAEANADSGGVQEFASALFNEPFCPEDLVTARRVRPHEDADGTTVRRDAEFYNDLHDAATRDRGNGEAASAIKEVLVRHGEYPLRASSADVPEMLYEILRNDEYVRRLQGNLADGPRDAAQMGRVLFPDASPDHAPEQLATRLIELGARARSTPEAASLIPARYHYFVRAPEGAFVQFSPEPRIMLDRRQERSGYRVFEVGACRRCGQEYIIGAKRDDFLRPVDELREIEESDFTGHTRYYLPLSRTLDADENEDEAVAVPDEASTRVQTYKLCHSCGLLRHADALGPCENCRADEADQSLVVEIDPKGQTLNQCFACGLRAPNIVQQFLFQKDAPSSVLATTLFTNLSGSPKDRKILAFSDSRQDAAFFAPYFERTYNRITYRRLMAEALSGRVEEEDYRLDSLARDVRERAESLHLFPQDYDGPARDRETWSWVLQEFGGLWDRRNSLEGTGVLTFEPIFPYGWNPPEFLTQEPWRLSAAEARALYVMLLNTVRHNFAITFPQGGPSHGDVFFAPRNRDYFIRGERSDSKRNVFAWLPATGHSNSRYEIVAKLAREVGADQEDIRNLLVETWRDLADRWVGNGLASVHAGAQAGHAYKLDHKFWRVRAVRMGELHVCTTCRSFASHNVRGVCPTYNCTGSLLPLSQEDQESLKSNHYRSLYSSLKPARATVHEHTAQLDPVYATQVQQRFIDGDINMLSCSTTFELGVDLGQLETVFLKNVPPEASNYVQRVGRAGRRAGNVGYALTFVQRRSHDLSYFRDPVRLVRGDVKPPHTTIENEKIVRRHVHSIALSAYFRQNREAYGKLSKFIDFERERYRSDDVLEYLNRKPGKVQESIENVLPPALVTQIDPDGWAWVEELVGADGVLRIAEQKIRQEYEELDSLIRELKNQYLDARGKQASAINARREWAERRQRTLESRSVIDFLSSNTVLPKYGFPVDVVEMDLYSGDAAGRQVRLARDLKIAISEFAPSNEVVANGYLWKSTGLKVVPGRAWDEYSYAICDCGQFNVRDALSSDGPGTCSACGQEIPRREWGRFVVPIFGFVSGHQEGQRKAGLYRPQTTYGSRPYFVGFGQESKDETHVGGFRLVRRYSKHAQLAVVAKGPKGIGYRICSECGYAEPLVRGRSARDRSHQRPSGRACSGRMEGPKSLGHMFTTDVLELFIDGPKPLSDEREEYDRWVSTLYALLEGLSTTLGIQRRDLNGCLNRREGSYSLILFDDVPGGAGHVDRLLNDENLRSVFQTARGVVENCTCGLETSCYSCLRNYSNQFLHSHLKRGLAVDLLQQLAE